MIDPERSSSPLDDIDGPAELLARSKPIAVARLQVLRAATAAAPTDDEAATVAHRLAGSPGMFGQSASSEVAQRINALVEATGLRRADDRAELAALVDRLDPLLEHDR